MSHESVNPNEEENRRLEKIQWHPGFLAGMELELKNYHLNFESEHQLTRGPLFIDILIIRKLTDEKIDNEIGEFFGRYNVMEFKSPGDELSIDVFYKVQAYAGLYKASGEHVNEIPADEMTVSLVRASYPSEMIKQLQKLGAKIVERHPGVYSIQGAGLFPTQVITTNRLTPETHSALRVLTTNVKHEDVKAFLMETQEMKNPGDKDRVDAILQVSVSANKELYRKIYKGEAEMCQALKDIMEEDFRKAEARSEAIGVAKGEAIGVEKGEAIGVAKGEAIGVAKGENKLGKLITELISLGRDQDVERVASDPAYREKLYGELSIV